MRTLIMIGALLSALGLSGCDDTYRITHVNQYPGWAMSYITSSGAVPVDVHGVPLRGMTQEEAVTRLEAPNGWPAGVRFIPSGPEATNRLVLVFNGGGPDAFRMCKEARRAQTSDAPATGFTVAAAYCSGDRPLARGYMVAPEATTGDPAQYPRLMRQFFLAVFQDERDHD